MPTETLERFVCRNTHEKPVRQGPHAGEVRPFITVPTSEPAGWAVAMFTPAEAAAFGGHWGEFVPVEEATREGLDVVPLIGNPGSGRPYWEIRRADGGWDWFAQGPLGKASGRVDDESAATRVAVAVMEHLRG